MSHSLGFEQRGSVVNHQLSQVQSSVKAGRMASQVMPKRVAQNEKLLQSSVNRFVPRSNPPEINFLNIAVFAVSEALRITMPLAPNNHLAWRQSLL